MNFKKKRSFWKRLRAALIILLFIGVPVWLFMGLLITESTLVGVVLIGLCLVSSVVVRRFE